MSVEEIQGYLLILSPLAMLFCTNSIFTLQDKNVKTYRIGEIERIETQHLKNKRSI